MVGEGAITDGKIEAGVRLELRQIKQTGRELHNVGPLSPDAKKR
jgi:hypothetical protein